MNRPRLSLLAPLLAVLALLLGLAGSASAAFNAAATDPHYGNFLLHTEAPARMPLAIADSSREIGVWLYDSTLGVPVYVQQNPWSSFDPDGLTAKDEFVNIAKRQPVGYLLDKSAKAWNHVSDIAANKGWHNVVGATAAAGAMVQAGADMVSPGVINENITNDYKANLAVDGSHFKALNSTFNPVVKAGVGLLEAKDGVGLSPHNLGKSLDGWDRTESGISFAQNFVATAAIAMGTGKGVSARVNASMTPVKVGIYEFIDTTGKPYVGQSSNIPGRLDQHVKSGKLDPNTSVNTTGVTGGKTAREIAEHKRIQEITGGVPARFSDKVSNKVDPIGPKRKHLLDE